MCNTFMLPQDLFIRRPFFSADFIISINPKVKFVRTFERKIVLDKNKYYQEKRPKLAKSINSL